MDLTLIIGIFRNAFTVRGFMQVFSVLCSLNLIPLYCCSTVKKPLVTKQVQTVSMSELHTFSDSYLDVTHILMKLDLLPSVTSTNITCFSLHGVTKERLVNQNIETINIQLSFRGIITGSNHMQTDKTETFSDDADKGIPGIVVGKCESEFSSQKLQGLSMKRQDDNVTLYEHPGDANESVVTVLQTTEGGLIADDTNSGNYQS